MALPKLYRRIIATSVACALLPLHPIASATETGMPGELLWGIRPSFNSYTNGPTFIKDGASQKGQDFAFPISSYSYDAASEHTEAQFSGAIVYRKYCSGGDGTDLSVNCDLDLTIANPKVVLDPNGSYLEATVSSKQYQTNETFAPAAPVKIAKLFTASANFSKTDTAVNWANIPTTLDPAGVKVFSEFYEPGSGLGAVTFSATGEGNRLSSDKAVLTAVDGTWVSQGKSYDSSRRELFAVGQKALVAENGTGLVLVDKELNTVAKIDFPLTNLGVADYDAANQYFYYTEVGPGGHSSYNTEIKRVKVHADSFGTPETVGTVADPVVALGVHDTTGKIIAITVKDVTDYNVPANDRTAHLYTIENGALSAPMELPNSETVFGKPVVEGGTAYGTLFPSYDRHAKLLSMNDGTFVFFPFMEAELEGESGANDKNGLLSIDLTASGNDVVKLLDGTRTPGQPFALEGIATDGNTIIRWDKNDAEEYARVQRLDYANRAVTAGEIKHPTLPGWAGVNWDQEGNPFALIGTNSKLVWFDTETFAPVVEDGSTKEIVVPNGGETFVIYQGNPLRLRDGSLFVPTRNRGNDDSYELKLFKNPTAPVLPDNTNDTNEDRLKEAHKEQTRRTFNEKKAALEAARAELAAAGDDEAAKKAASEKVAAALTAYRTAAEDYYVLFPGKENDPNLKDETPTETTPETTKPQPTETAKPQPPATQPADAGSSAADLELYGMKALWSYISAVVGTLVTVLVLVTSAFLHPEMQKNLRNWVRR
ncbi:HtaA domain-containing protein [Corynebacterium sp. HS2168-gen11]|uniref:HtaA domain-containing protein n=1 Tax=Corynebacterium sp. HS2168-gen11 TaxID=2974027 RepID=UPI00216B26BC|nr:HtaA domain-containing protein [Corynebacterium sp. HS2168-gen11]MCS4535675.1 HtaA domain-containing protein [Corynebacterium sp. HS2168-gen11]